MRTAWLVVASFLTAWSLSACSAAGPAALPAAPAAAGVGSSTVAPTSTQRTEARDRSCTDRIDYAGDPRSNAEINSIGERTGTCPPVRKQGPKPSNGRAEDPNVSCTNRFDYAGDPRSNAEINSIGASTGTCPLPQR